MVEVEAMLKASKALQKPAITAVIIGLLLTFDSHSALAASGENDGRSRRIRSRRAIRHFVSNRKPLFFVFSAVLRIVPFWI
uniref:Uncharacterized protein n=1 Tax=Nelumbo nucifera TaxID=4432 RepID=A0A822XKS3_NELNU|nr:TPA_asm: hypothetical protein HUJ06_021009 [Nelumbo nucifera]